MFIFSIQYASLAYMHNYVTTDCIKIRNYTIFFIASQMWLLGRILTLLVGLDVDEDDELWENFCTMMDVVDILFSQKVSKDLTVYLKSLISKDHEEFKRLYLDASIIPKMHFMIHMPRLISELVLLYHCTFHCFQSVNEITKFHVHNFCIYP